jgi:hypothetical protein
MVILQTSLALATSPRGGIDIRTLFGILQPHFAANGFRDISGFRLLCLLNIFTFIAANILPSPPPRRHQPSCGSKCHILFCTFPTVFRRESETF